MNLSRSYDFFKPEQQKHRIHIIGCGSVGSTVAENLTRCGITNLALYDFDTVESHNLANQMFREEHIGQQKVEALAKMLEEINPEIQKDIKLFPKGWENQMLSGYIFLCVDQMEVRKAVTQKHMQNLNVKAMFDFRTRLLDAQHYAADWKDHKMKQDFLQSMNFTQEEAMAETPTSACGGTLSVAPTIRIISGYGVANFINFWNGKPLKKLIVADAFGFQVDAF